MPKETVCGVRLATWGTHEGGGNGMLDFLDKKLFAGNVGHAAVSVTFPANEQTKEWIRKYCLDPAIPYEKHKVTTQKAVQDKDGKYQKSAENYLRKKFMSLISAGSLKQGVMPYLLQSIAMA